MAENILKRLVINSQAAISDGTYEIDANMQKSSKDFIQIIKSNPRPTLLTGINFATKQVHSKHVKLLTNCVLVSHVYLSLHS